MWSFAQLKARLKEVLSAHSSPHEIALGFSVGTLIAILPTPGFNYVLGALAVSIYPHLNKLAVFGAITLYNPIVLIPFFWASYKTGGLIYGLNAAVEYDAGAISKASDFTRRFLVGNLIVAVVTSLLSYPLVHKLVRYQRSRHDPSSRASE